MFVICLIKVVLASMPHDIAVLEVEGKVLGQSRESLLVDFSSEAKRRKFIGDYSKEIVFKEKCRRD